MDKKAIIVLGMHRSGTSAMTRVLNLVGADLPTDLMPPRADNRLGFWESLEVAETHDEFLNAIGRSWHDISTIDPRLFESAPAIVTRTKLLAILRRDFAESPLFVVKDPRACRVLPLWLSILAEFEAKPHFIIIGRNPREIASSLKVRDGFHPAKSMLLWLRHVLDAEYYTRGFPRSFVSYDLLLRDWRQCLKRIGKDLHITWPRVSHAADVEIESFLSDKERHHREISNDMDREEISPWIKQSYEISSQMVDCDGDQPRQELLDAFDHIRRQLDIADVAFGPILELDRRQLSNMSDVIKEFESALFEKDRYIEAKDRDLEAMGAELENNRNAVAEKDTYTRELAAELESTRNALVEKDGHIGELAGELENNRNAVAEKDAYTRELAAELESARSALLERDTQIRELVEQARATMRQTDQDRCNLAADLETQRAATFDRDLEIDSLNSDLQKLQFVLDAKEADLQEFAAALEAEKVSVAEKARQIERLSLELEHEKNRMQEPFGRVATMENALYEARLLLSGRDALITDLEAKVATAPSSTWRVTYSLHLPTLVFKIVDSIRKRLSPRSEYRLVRKSHLFDPDFYLTQYPDVAAAGTNPLEHFLRSGARDGRKPSPLFDPEYYLSAYPDVAAAGVNPLVHYIMSGAREGRNPSASFDTAFYVHRYPDVSKSRLNPLAHYYRFGAREGRHPNSHALLDAENERANQTG